MAAPRYAIVPGDFASFVDKDGKPPRLVHLAIGPAPQIERRAVTPLEFGNGKMKIWRKQHGRPWVRQTIGSSTALL